MVLPQRSPLVEEFDHFSLAFTYDCIIWSGEPPGGRESFTMIGYITNEEAERADPESTIGIMNMLF